MEWNFSVGPGESANERLIRQLQRPAGPVDVVIDTDTAAEIDDQFALAFLINSGDKLRLKGIHAAPFSTKEIPSPVDGMEKSYGEILNILHLMDRDDLQTLVRKGSGRYLPSETEYVDSQAARALAELAMQYTPEKPLYVICIADITNVASAILLNPEIADRIVIIWLGGNSLWWPDNDEFNISQDIAAGRVIFGCGAALVQLPCMGVVSSFTTSGPELKHWLGGKNKLCDYLIDLVFTTVARDSAIPAWTRVLWDVCAVGWLLDGGFMKDRLEHSPIPEYSRRYSIDQSRHLFRYVYHINRDLLMNTLFEKITR
ncbi:MAG: nucleoside hydrolase [Treponema sp.]|nr:nucleoside hydrolase [Treponema sp.]